MKRLFIFLLFALFFVSFVSADLLYLNSTATSGACPATSKKLSGSVGGSTAWTWPGEFDSGFPGTSDAGQFRPGSANLANTTTSVEIMNSTLSSRTPGSFGQGWLYDINVTGYTLSQGDFMFNVSLMGGQGGTGQSERLFARASIVTCSGGNFVFVKDLFATNCAGGTCSGGQNGWRANDGVKITHPAVNSIVQRSVNVTSNDTHVFSEDQRLFIEIGFGDGDSTTDRTFGLRYNDLNSLIVTPEFLPPDTTLPSASLIAPANSSIALNSLIYFTANFSDNTALKNATLFVWNFSGSLIGNNFTNILGVLNSSNLSFNLPYSGNFSWNYLVFDNSGNSAFASSNFTLSFSALDTTPPVIIINYPTNTTLNSSVPLLNLTIIEQNISKVWISVDGGQNITYAHRNGTIDFGYLNLIFADDFDEYLNGSDGSPTWTNPSIFGGAVVINKTYNLYNGTAQVSALSYITNFSQYNYWASSKVMIPNGSFGGAYLTPRFADVNNKYEIALDYDWSSININKVVSGVFTNLAALWTGNLPTPIYVVKDEWHNLGLRIAGQNVSAYVDKQLALSISDSDLNYDGFSIISFDDTANHSTYFDDVEIHSDLGYGQHNLTVYANDSAGNLNYTTITFFIGVDSIPPSTYLLSPINGSTTTSNTNYFAVNSTDDLLLKNATLRLWNSSGTLILTNYTQISGTSNITNLSLAIPYGGTFFWNYLVYDNSSNSALNNTVFTLLFAPQDTTPPSVLGLIPLLNSNFSVGQQIEIGANTTDDAGISSVFANITLPNGTANFIPLSLASGNKYNSTFSVPFLTGRYNISFSANDTFGNINYSESSYFNAIDSEAPVYSNFSVLPLSPAVYSSLVNYTFNISWTDYFGVSGAFVSFGGINYSMLFIGSDVYSKTFSDLGAGNYTYYLWANDTSGNINLTSASVYSILNASGNISLLLNGSAGNLTSNFGTLTNASASTLFGGASLFRNGIDATSFNNQNILLGAGIYNYTATSSGDQNHSSATLTRWVQITQADPTLNYYLNGAVNNFSVAYPMQINASAYTNAGTLQIFRDGISVVNGQNYTLGVGYYRFDYNVTGDQNYSDVSAVLFANITQASQSFTPLLNGNNANLVINYPQQINASYSGTNQTAVSINVNGTSVLIGQNYTFGAGDYAINYSALSNQNYSAFSGFLNLTINKAVGLVYLYLNNSRNNITVIQGSSILLNGTLIDGQFGSLNLTIDGLQINYSANSNLITNYNFSAIGNFVVRANYSGNANYTSAFEEWNVSVLAPPDLMPPNVSIIYPQNISYNTNVSQLNYTVSNDVQSCWYSLNNGATNVSLVCGINATGLISAEGNSTWRVYANDSAGNLNSSSVTFFKDTVLPLVNFVSPTLQSGSLTNNNSININVTASDTNLANITVRLYNSTGDLISQNISAFSPFNITYSGLLDGFYLFNATAVDNLNNQNSAETRNVTIDTVAPSITIVSPLNQSYNNATILINLSISDNQSVWFYNGTANESYSSPVYRIFAQGSNTLIAYANDSAGNLNTTSVVFFVDSIYPLISYGIGTENDGATVSRNWVYVNVSATEANEANITFRLFNSTSLVNESVFFNGRRDINWTGLSNSIYYYNVTVIDVLNNQNTTQTRSIKLDLDMIAPTFSNFVENPINGTAYVQGQIYRFNATINEINVRSAGIEFNGINYSVQNISNVYIFNISNLAAGNYQYYWWANDSAGNFNISGARYYTISKATGNVSLLLNGNTNDINISYQTQINASAGSGTGSIVVYRNGVNVILENGLNVTLGVSYYNYTAVASESQNYSSATISRFVNVTKGNVLLNISFSPGNNITYLTNVVVNSTGCVSELNCVLYRNGINVTNPDTGLLGVGLYNYTFNTTGNENYSSSGFSDILNVNKAAGVVYTYLNNSRSNITIVENTAILLNGTLVNGSGNIFLYNNGALINNGSGNLSNLTNFSSIETFNVTTIYSGNENYTSASETFYVFVVDANAPLVNIVYPVNGSTYNGNVAELNYTVSDSQLQSCWYSLNNGVTNTTIICGQNVTGLNSNEGSNTWRVYANDSASNLGTGIVTFNVNLPSQIRCEVGGPYQQGALVLLQGNVSNSTSPINSLSVNASLYNSQNILNISKILITSSDGSYETTFSNLIVGSYSVNVSAVYNNIPSSCVDNLQIGSPAFFVLSKIANIYNLSNDTINYNVSLILSNIGGVSASESNITDDDSLSSPYSVGTVSANSTVVVSYIKNFSRQSSTTYYLLSSTIVRGMDSYSGNMISANSSTINITIPAFNIGNHLTIIKNIVFVSENSTAVNYNISSTLYNSGDSDLSGIVYTDSDINSTSFVFNLTRGSSQVFSNLIVIAKAASNTQHQFALGTAVVGVQSFYSNQPTVNIPGYGGPADVIVYAPAQVNSAASFNSVIEVKNINPDIGQDFTTDYWITSNDESVNFTSGQQTVYISANGSTNITATLTSPSSAGNYRLRALTSWVGGTATSYDSFSVIDSSGGGPTGSGSSPSGSSPGATPGSGSPITGGIITPPEIVCNAPDIRYGEDCCLDENGNNICDSDEIEPAPPVVDKIPTITGFAGITESIVFRRIVWSTLLFVLSIILLAVLHLYTRRHHYVSRGIGLVSQIKGLRVYTDSGIKIGKVCDVLITDNRIYGLIVIADKAVRKKRCNFLIDYKCVHNIKDVVIVSSYVLDSLTANSEH